MRPPCQRGAQQHKEAGERVSTIPPHHARLAQHAGEKNTHTPPGTEPRRNAHVLVALNHGVPLMDALLRVAVGLALEGGERGAQLATFQREDLVQPTELVAGQRGAGGGVRHFRRGAVAGGSGCRAEGEETQNAALRTGERPTTTKTHTPRTETRPHPRPWKYQYTCTSTGVPGLF